MQAHKVNTVVQQIKTGPSCCGAAAGCWGQANRTPTHTNAGACILDQRQCQALAGGFRENRRDQQAQAATSRLCSPALGCKLAVGCRDPSGTRLDICLLPLTLQPRPLNRVPFFHLIAAPWVYSE